MQRAFVLFTTSGACPQVGFFIAAAIALLALPIGFGLTRTPAVPTMQRAIVLVAAAGAYSFYLASQ